VAYARYARYVAGSLTRVLNLEDQADPLTTAAQTHALPVRAAASRRFRLRLDTKMTLPPLSYLYLDDSGTRNPDWEPKDPPEERDSFCTGGVIDEDKQAIQAAHAKFCLSWKITYPLHSTEIRHQEKNFKWLGTISPDELNKFHTELGEMLATVPVIGHACVVHRPGYDARYRKQYGRQTWHLCKTAFTVVVERVAKLVQREGRQLIVHHELTDPDAMKRIRSYYKDLKSAGLPFDANTSAKYAPLKREEFEAILLDFSFKPNANIFTQIADLYLYPMRRSGYDLRYRPHEFLVQRKKPIDCHLTEQEVQIVGIKYSCFDGLVKT
jgi:hypothetical protein